MTLWIPVVGDLVEKTIVARTMRTLGTLVSSGVPILEAINIVKETANNAVFERMFQRVLESIREGDTIADPLRESRLVDDRVVVTSCHRSWCPGTARGGAWVAGAAARSRAEKRTDRFREVELHDIIVTGQ